MATPLGHALAGLSIACLIRRPREVSSPRWLAFSVVAANLADADFILGFLIGDINRFHQLFSHTFLAACLFGAAIALTAPSWRLSLGSRRLWLVSAGLYASHLALDFLTRDQRAPFGQFLFWPLWPEALISSWTPFGGIKHGVPGDSILEFVENLFSVQNLWVLALEFAVLGPFFGLACLAAARRDAWMKIATRSGAQAEREGF